MRNTYLLINFFTILIPFLWSFERKLRFMRGWKSLLPAIVIPAILFLVWDYFKTSYGVWGFNPEYVLGIYLFGLPLEEILFFITVPYSCIFIYAVMNYYLPEQLDFRPLRLIITIAGITFFILSFLVWGKAYTWSVFFFSGIVLPVLAQILTSRQLFIFMISYFISFLPMFIVNGLLTSLPVVVYNDAHNLSYRIGTIPVEDFIYFLVLYSLNIGIYERLKKQISAAPA